MSKKKPSALGRPIKPDKFNAFLSFPCYRELLEGLESYRIEKGLRSRGEAARQIIAKVVGGK